MVSMLVEPSITGCGEERLYFRDSNVSGSSLRRVLDIRSLSIGHPNTVYTSIYPAVPESL